ncbi:T9SS type A sorting domain-containing protein [Aquimarina sp. ERC-38]|uniref:T9SS type A sorting domain-containing protein n=1 Tax=Aquimarina sp. ERC-38 TaxID=2949996 RepID=UPI002246B3EE|nr:T9SS type A sorting domain-containing protein [Aquimarina sp. ERC-38]UZO81487.1 T9SS type A sorting domain-containing protein [Aquimarina sp. ERC-38]
MKPLKIYILLMLCFGSSLFSQTNKLLFTYDKSGNQVQREYCTGSCFILKKTIEDLKEDKTLANQFNGQFVMYPNPTNGILIVEWSEISMENLQSIKLVNYLGSKIKEVPIKQFNSYKFNLSSYSTGMYLLQFKFKDNSTFSQKIIKN